MDNEEKDIEEILNETYIKRNISLKEQRRIRTKRYENIPEYLICLGAIMIGLIILFVHYKIFYLIPLPIIMIIFCFRIYDKIYKKGVNLYIYQKFLEKKVDGDN